MKKLSLLFLFTLMACDPTIQIEKGSQTHSDEESSTAGKDVTSLIRSHLRTSSDLRGSCQLLSTEPALWGRPRISVWNILNYSLSIYSDSLCNDSEGSLTLHFNINKISTTSSTDKFLMELELTSSDLYLSNPGSYDPSDFHDYEARIGEAFFWQIQFDAAIPDSDISMPRGPELEQPTSADEPLETTEMFYVSRPS